MTPQCVNVSRYSSSVVALQVEFTSKVQSKKMASFDLDSDCVNGQKNNPAFTNVNPSISEGQKNAADLCGTGLIYNVVNTTT